MKTGWRPRCSSVAYGFRYAPLLAPCRRPILIATNGMLFRRQDTNENQRGRLPDPVRGLLHTQPAIQRLAVPAALLQPCNIPTWILQTLSVPNLLEYLHDPDQRNRAQRPRHEWLSAAHHEDPNSSRCAKRSRSFPGLFECPQSLQNPHGVSRRSSHSRALIHHNQGGQKDLRLELIPLPRRVSWQDTEAHISVRRPASARD